MTETQTYLDIFGAKGLIPYEELGNQPDQRWVSHLNCYETTPLPYPERILDEGPAAMCWKCKRVVDPEDMIRIREAGTPVETPGTSCWWILEMK